MGYWRVRIGRKVLGPYTDEQLQDEIVRGVVGVYDEARREVEPRYREILDYPELFPAFREGLRLREEQWPGSSAMAQKTLDEAVVAHEQAEVRRLATEDLRDQDPGSAGRSLAIVSHVAPSTAMVTGPTEPAATQGEVAMPPKESPIVSYVPLTQREFRSLESRERKIENAYGKDVDRAIKRNLSDDDYQRELAAIEWRRWYALRELATEFGVNHEQMAERAAKEAARAAHEKRMNTILLAGTCTVLLFMGVAAMSLSNSCDQAREEARLKEVAEQTKQAALQEAIREREREEKASRERAKAAEQRAKIDRREATFKLPVADRARLAMERLSKTGDDAHCGLCLSDYYISTFNEDERKQAPAAQAIAVQKMRKAAEIAKLQAETNANRGIVCVDGSGSSCTCGGNHRGCCSHHGGIKGCEPVEKVDDIDCTRCPYEP